MLDKILGFAFPLIVSSSIREADLSTAQRAPGRHLGQHGVLDARDRASGPILHAVQERLGLGARLRGRNPFRRHCVDRGGVRKHLFGEHIPP